MGSIYKSSILQNPSVAKRYIPKHKKPEENLQLMVCSYVRMQYPHIIFRSDFASGLSLSIHQAAKHKRLQSSRAFPDLFLFSPQVIDGKQYAGLAIELKKDGTKIYKRDGKIVSNPHIQEQAEMLKRLNELGYMARFAIGFDNAQKLIDGYMGKPINTSIF
jgi:hypothetical protein